ncbi:MAG: right-handed parallel beta-helix repeat-containing protein [Deltaproteobacteria bacterium]|nr:right-handed parallel beta-helix repeat-containing protein [Deltaproteobacteria bacterium]
MTFPFPTLRNATVEWAITGDANENGAVSIRFRKTGDTAWRRGLPLRRIPKGTLEGFSWANRHAGSIFDLEPATTYEIEAFLLDPDGGCEVRTGTFTTRSVPAPMAGAPIKAATPSTLSSVASGAAPGDVIELAAGTYAGFSFPKDGAPGKPIVLRGAGAVTINGDVSLIGRKYVHLTGVTVNGRIRANLSVEVAVTKNVVNTASDGVAATLRSENLYVADNRITGSTSWSTAALGVSGDNRGEGIWVTGPGHVIEHNLVSGFRDCISLLEGSEAVDQYSIDIVHNDLRNCADDGVEADFCAHDCRVVRNRLTNTFIALSSQPGLGGPTYFVRNAMYNVILSAFKLQRGSIGDVVLHNTVVKNGDALGIYTDVAFERQWFRNNLFLGGPGGTYNGYSSGTGRVISLASAAANGDYDYDGFGSTTGKFEGRLGAVSFASLAELQAKTTEKHAVALGLDVFASTVAYPTSPFPAREPVSLAIKAGSAAEDVALVLPNVNDGYVGAGPDLGAHERGAAIPAYGPR